MNQNNILSALFDMYDIKKTLSDKIKNKRKDNEGSEITIGQCIDDVILLLEQLTQTK